MAAEIAEAVHTAEADRAVAAQYGMRNLRKSIMYRMTVTWGMATRAADHLTESPGVYIAKQPLVRALKTTQKPPMVARPHAATWNAGVPPRETK